jgi:hypothetical protein
MPTCSNQALALALLLSAIQPAARASEEASPSVANAPEVSDDLLAGVRGRFVAANGVVRFGVQMITTWQTDTGNTYRASGTLSVGLEGKPQVQFVPQLSVSETAGATAPSVERNSVRGGASLSGVSGVVQSIQVAGDGNQIRNDAVVSISTNASNMPSTAGGTAATSLAAVTPQGVRLSSSVDAHGMAVTIEVPQAGRALQQLRSGASAGILQVGQSAADLQRVQNHLNVFVQTAPGRTLAHDGALNSLRAMHGARLY